MEPFDSMKLEEFEKFLNKKLEITYYENLDDESTLKKTVGSLSINDVGIEMNNLTPLLFMIYITEQKTENSIKISKRQIKNIQPIEK
jgi:hypothetical protein